MQNLYSEKYTSNDVELDVNEKLPITEILKLMQRTTFSHSQLIGLDHQTMIDRDNAFWVITKMKVVCNNSIGANQKLTLKTWTRPPQAVRFLRDLQIKETAVICGFADEFAEYKISVSFSDVAKKLLSENEIDEISSVLSNDPKPSYQHDLDREYGMSYGNYEIKFRYYQDEILVFDIQKK